ncbi:PREDICTED: solute carrier organic anion transporter family member 1A3-like, partial [Tinamus guttatus]|uniref:solute carrier organic anion transporter family member 1A3-like n=1 Tax=Tinamus guttatus TaxID=94827 RepID=UPI00052EBDB8
NLLLIAFVSYFGAKLHRPRMIALGCTVLSFGCLLISLPHFLMGRYQIESSISPSENSSVMPLYFLNQSSSPTEEPLEDCEKEPGSMLWIFVMIGNIIRGMGETPIMPLGISYLEDFAKAENSPFYLGCLQTATVIGPFLGFLLGSFCAKLFVDVGSVNAEDITITVTDARWVGAWWLGILICASLNLLAGIPFWFLPKTLVKEGETNEPEEVRKKSVILLQENEAEHAKHSKHGIAKGVYNLPVICIGYFFGGLLLKKFKTNTFQTAMIAFCIFLLEYLFSFMIFRNVCDASPVAGL